MIDDLKNSPIPSLFFLGYRISDAHRNKKDEIVIHFSKNAPLYEENETMLQVCLQKLNECIQPHKKSNQKISKIDKADAPSSKSFLRRLWDIFCKIFPCFKCKK